LNLIKILLLEKGTNFMPIVEVLTTALSKGALSERLAAIRSKAAERKDLNEEVVGFGRNDDVVAINPNLERIKFKQLHARDRKTPEDQSLELKRVTVSHRGKLLIP
jgi:hypothetical protein